MSGQFLSCDWGTSSFRLRLVSLPALDVFAEETNGNGVAEMYRTWMAAEPREERFACYGRYLERQIAALSERVAEPLRNVPLIISGMASSSIGMLELPYTKAPFRADGAGIIVQHTKLSETDTRPLTLVSGAKTATDVMRGEETMLVGCDASVEQPTALYIFPGTHSKHVSVTNGSVTDLKTYMTGEYFKLLSAHSILSASVEKNDFDGTASGPFVQGVLEGAEGNLLNATFRVRTNQLFSRYTTRENYHYLSGLLIGTELRTLASAKPATVSLVANVHLKAPYQTALTTLRYDDVLHIDADRALLNGQARLLRSRL